jgi:plastocyanin
VTLLRRTSLPALLCLAALAAGCGGGDSGSSGGDGPAVLAPGDTIGMKNLRFHPDRVQVPVGQEVTWVDEESIPHDVVAQSGADFRSEVFGKGKSYSWTPTEAGTVKYECTLHPGMDGEISVVAG